MIISYAFAWHINRRASTICTLLYVVLVCCHQDQLARLAEEAVRLRVHVAVARGGYERADGRDSLFSSSVEKEGVAPCE